MRDEDLIAQFTTYLLAERRVSHNTYLAYRADVEQLRLHLAEQKLTFCSCSTPDLKGFVKHLHDNGVRPRSISRKISSIKLMYEFLSERFNEQNTAEPLIFPKFEQTLPEYLTDKEIVRFFKAANADSSKKGLRNKAMVNLLYASGMRVSELVNLSVDQVHFDTGFIHLMGKGNKERQVPLPKSTLTFLRRYLGEVWGNLLPKAVENKKNLMFPTAKNGTVSPITRQSVWNIFKRLLSIAGIKKNVSPHTLLHSLATHLLKNGANIRSLQMLLGHENITTVQVYTHLETDHLREIYDKKHPRA